MREAKGAFLGMLVSILLIVGWQRVQVEEEALVTVKVADQYQPHPVFSVVSNFRTYLFAVRLVDEDGAYTQKVRVFASKGGFDKRQVGLASMMAPSDPIEFDNHLQRIGR